MQTAIRAATSGLLLLLAPAMPGRPAPAAASDWDSHAHGAAQDATE